MFPWLEMQTKVKELQHENEDHRLEPSSVTAMRVLYRWIQPPSGPTPCQTNTPARGGLPRLNEWALGRGGAAGLGGAGRGWAWGRGHPNGG